MGWGWSGGVEWGGASHGMAASTDFIPLVTHIIFSSLPYSLHFSAIFPFYPFLYFLTLFTSLLFSLPCSLLLCLLHCPDNDDDDDVSLQYFDGDS